MPDAAVRVDHGTVTSRAMPLLCPRIEDRPQVAAEPATEPRHRRRQRRPAPFPRAARRTPAVLGQQRTQLLHDGVFLLQKRQQGPSGIQTPNDHDYQGFDEQLIRVGLRPSPLALPGGRGKRQVLHQADQADKKAVTIYQAQYLLDFELDTEMLGRRARVGKPCTRSSSQFNDLRFVTTAQLSS